MAKAYDMVEWDVQKLIMRLHRFGDKFLELIINCISTSIFSILVNGFLSSSKGI